MRRPQESSRQVLVWLTLQQRKLFELNAKQTAKWAIFIVTILFLVLVTISSVYLNPFGKNPRSDEYIYTSSAEYILSGHVCRPYTFYALASQKLCNLEHPPLVKEIMAVSIFFFGRDMWGARLPSMIFGTLCIPIVAYIGWRLTRRLSVAVISASLMAFNPLLIGSSSIAMLDTAEIFFTLCAIALYLSSLFGRHTIWKLLMVGNLFGLSILSKEVAVFALLAIVTYSFFELRLVTALKRSVFILAGSALTTIAGFEFYDHHFTSFPNPANHIVFIIDYAKSIQGYYVSTNPELWLTSLANRDLGSGLGVMNPTISFPVFFWIPLFALYVVSRRSTHALMLPAILLIWTYFPYFVMFDYFHRDVKYFYSIQMTPALVVGAAYLYSTIGEKLVSRKRFGRKLNVTAIVCVLSFSILLYYLSGAGVIMNSTTKNQSPVIPPPPYGKYGFQNLSAPSILSASYNDHPVIRNISQTLLPNNLEKDT